MLAMFDDDDVKMRFFENLMEVMPPCDSPERYIELRRAYEDLAASDRSALSADEVHFLERVLTKVRDNLRRYEDADPNEIVSNMLARASHGARAAVKS